MDQVRNFTQANKGSIVNIIYIIAAVVLVYYLVMYYFNDSEGDLYLLKNKIPMSPSQGYDEYATAKQYVVVEKNATAYRAKSEYTISFWMYINSYAPTNSGVKGVLSFFGEHPETITSDLHANLFVGLHPSQPKMIIRYGNLLGGLPAKKYTLYTSDGKGNITNDAMNTVFENGVGDALTPCDVMDVDIQRWINVTISVNGRILDVYMDGKLARSCIMENVQNLSQTEAQVIYGTAGFTNTYSGYISGIVFSNYALTPDVIYGRYQAGPYTSQNFLDYLKEKLGVNITINKGTA